MSNTLEIIITIVTSLGGIKAIEWLWLRKSYKRKAEVEADTDEFRLLKELVVFLQETLKAKEERFQEKIARERELLDEINNLTTELAVLRAERKMKLCEVRNCLQREPQSGY